MSWGTNSDLGSISRVPRKLPLWAFLGWPPMRNQNRYLKLSTIEYRVEEMSAKLNNELNLLFTLRCRTYWTRDKADLGEGLHVLVKQRTWSCLKFYIVTELFLKVPTWISFIASAVTFTLISFNHWARSSRRHNTQAVEWNRIFIVKTGNKALNFLLFLFSKRNTCFLVSVDL